MASVAVELCAHMLVRSSYLQDIESCSFLERLTGGRHVPLLPCIHPHGLHFITSLFTWSHTAVPVAHTASLFVEGDLRCTAQNAKRGGISDGVPARSGDSVLKDNITVRQGDSAVLK
ncbi:unnamed protein product [Pleuronectes platessa]|uniref:Uncharacterized protein n=1 Tax=Pleuronectes platessa TaxID=8262 RepID=A0A9N7VE47_PLEPL|nr:unnamed protein product [Pleuronectes platessa]